MTCTSRWKASDLFLLCLFVFLNGTKKKKKKHFCRPNADFVHLRWWISSYILKIIFLIFFFKVELLLVILVTFVASSQTDLRRLSTHWLYPFRTRFLKRPPLSSRAAVAEEIRDCATAFEPQSFNDKFFCIVHNQSLFFPLATNQPVPNLLRCLWACACDVQP